MPAKAELTPACRALRPAVSQTLQQSAFVTDQLSGSMCLALYAPPVERVVLQVWSFPRIAAQIFAHSVSLTTTTAGTLRDT